MLELFLAAFVGALAVLAACFFRSFFQWKSQAGNKCKGKTVPGWDDSPDDAKMGDLRLAQSSGSLHHYLMRRHRGGRCPVISFWWRDKRVVSVCSPEAFKETENLYNRPKLLYEVFSEPLHGSVSIQSVNDDEWYKRRKALQNTFRGTRLDSFFSEFVTIAQETELRWTPGQPIPLLKEIFRMTLKSILCTSFGNIFKDDSGIEELANTYHLCRREMSKRILSVPSSESQRELDFQRNLECLKESTKQILQARKEQPDSKELPLMDALLKSGATEDLILWDLITFMGGFHTSGYFGLWVFYYLAQYPQIQEKLFHDIKDKVGDDCGEKLKAYALTSNTYLRQVFDEVMRIIMIVPFSAHYSNEDLIIGGYHVPAKTPIILAMGVAMKNEAIWQNPDTFDPDRFAPGSKHAKRGPEFRPFGVSVLRRCPANLFTYCMMAVFVTVLVRRFFISAVDEQVLEKVLAIVTSPKDEILIRVEQRS